MQAKPVVRETCSKEYRAYIRMLHRCYNADYPGYQNWGGRGIDVCPRWRHGPLSAGYANFLADMGRAPSPSYTLERVKNHLGYSPENCKWATWQEQGNNRRNNRRIAYRGMTLTLTQWADFLGFSRKKLWKRLKMWGLDYNRIFSPWPETTGKTKAA